ncbi:hypothetical protein BCE02nite_24200 [Brevibacillus centrosporus]|nr:hypothetical protein BCE02nite_24200 [Brevibacillus centrosporus]
MRLVRLACKVGDPIEICTKIDPTIESPSVASNKITTDKNRIEPEGVAISHPYICKSEQAG